MGTPELPAGSALSAEPGGSHQGGQWEAASGLRRRQGDGDHQQREGSPARLDGAPGHGRLQEEQAERHRQPLQVLCHGQELDHVDGDLMRQMSTSEKPRDVSGVELLMNNHQGHKAEIDAREDNFGDLYSLGKELLSMQHYASNEIKE